PESSVRNGRQHSREATHRYRKSERARMRARRGQAGEQAGGGRRGRAGEQAGEQAGGGRRGRARAGDRERARAQTSASRRRKRTAAASSRTAAMASIHQEPVQSGSAA